MKHPTSGIEVDFFGDADPKKMPAHLWGDLRSMDYSTAVRADISKQHYTVCPRHWYIDAVYHCIDCHQEFTFAVSEQRFWYEERGFFIDALPNRCVACRKKERVRKRQAQLPKKDRQ